MDAKALILLALITAGNADVRQLGSTEFRSREAAHGRLSKSIDKTILSVLAGEGSPDPEIAGRCRVLANQWFCCHAEQIVATLKPSGWRDYPFITILHPSTLDQYEREYYFLMMAGADGEHGVTERGQKKIFTLATKLMLVEMVKARQPTANVLQFLCEQHRVLCKEMGWKVPP